MLCVRTYFVQYILSDFFLTLNDIDMAKVTSYKTCDNVDAVVESLRMIMMKMMMNCFCGMVDWRKAFSLISNRDHYQRSSPSRISDTPRAGFEPMQNLSLSLFEWSCAIVITTTPSSYSSRLNIIKWNVAHISAIYIIDIRTGDSNQIQIENSLIKSSEKLLGIKFDQQLPLDQQLSFDQHIKSLFEKANVKKTKSVCVGCSLYGIRNKKKEFLFFCAITAC